jgi:hypothetical protein
MNKSLIDAYQKARQQFLAYRDVIGVGHGPKFTGGREVKGEAIVVLVLAKLPVPDVPKGELIPTTYLGFPTDVRVPCLSMPVPPNFNYNRPPDDPNVQYPSDVEWVDWGKIHQLKSLQPQPEPRGPDGPADTPPTTQTVGNLLVIHDPSKTLVKTVGTPPNTQKVIDLVGAYKLFRTVYGDDYDFVSFYIDVDPASSGMPYMGNASTDVYNAVTGTGKAAVNVRSTWGTTKLLREIYHSWFTPSPRTLMHEVGHQWLMYVNYRETATGATRDLLHQDWSSAWPSNQRNYHWGRWPDHDNTSMSYDRADWVDNGNGTFNRNLHGATDEQLPNDTWFGFPSLEQYLMGLIPASEVAPVTIVQSPTPAIDDTKSGPYTPNPSAATVTIAQVQYEEGQRSPDDLHSQRVFHHAVVVITGNASQTSTFITDSETQQAHYTNRIRRATSGRMLVDTSLLRPGAGDLYLRDNDTDAGGTTSTGEFWLSPDLWVRNLDDGMTANQLTIRGKDNWVYVRVHNKGAQAYDNVTVNVYLGNFKSLVPGTEFLYPVDWNPQGLIGSVTLASVPAASGGVAGEAIGKILWPASQVPPAAGWHPCLLAEIIPAEISPSGLHHVWENKKLAQRNITIIDAPAGDVPALSFVSKFTVGHRRRKARVTELRMRVVGKTQGLALFLDPGSLLPDFWERGPVVDLPIPIELGMEVTPETAIQVIEALSPGELELVATNGAAPNGSSVGSPYSYRVVAEFGWKDQGGFLPHLPTPWFRFINEGGMPAGAFATATQSVAEVEQGFEAEIEGMHGLKPMVLNGLPLLRLANLRDARLRLPVSEGQTATLRLIGIISPFHHGKIATCHITEKLEGSIIGGLAIQIGQ